MHYHPFIKAAMWISSQIRFTHPLHFFSHLLPLPFVSAIQNCLKYSNHMILFHIFVVFCMCCFFYLECLSRTFVWLTPAHQSKLSLKMISPRIHTSSTSFLLNALLLPYMSRLLYLFCIYFGIIDFFFFL